MGNGKKRNNDVNKTNKVHLSLEPKPPKDLSKILFELDRQLTNHYL